MPDTIATMNPDDFPEGTVLVEIIGIYDGWSVAQMPDGSMVNRWEPGDRRYAPTQAWIERKGGRDG